MDPAVEDALIPLSALQRYLFCPRQCALIHVERVEPAQWVALKARLTAEIEPSENSLRFYRLGAEGRRRVEHVGAKPALDLDGPLVF